MIGIDSIQGINKRTCLLPGLTSLCELCVEGEIVPDMFLDQFAAVFLALCELPFQNLIRLPLNSRHRIEVSA